MVDEDQYAAGYGIVGKPSATTGSTNKALITDHDIRCQAQTRPDPDVPGQLIACGCLLARTASRPWQIQCRRCKSQNKSPL